jgi:predicted DNA-binding protein YlxM (UPF0122 family)
MSEIAKKINISKCCVYNCIKSHEEIERFIERKRYERSKQISEQDQHHLKRLVQDDNGLSASKITKDLNQYLPASVSERTAFNY